MVSHIPQPIWDEILPKFNTAAEVQAFFLFWEYSEEGTCTFACSERELAVGIQRSRGTARRARDKLLDLQLIESCGTERDGTHRYRMLYQLDEKSDEVAGGPDVAGQLVALGFDEAGVLELLNAHDEREVIKQLAHHNWLMRMGKSIAHPEAWLRSAVKHQYEPPDAFWESPEAAQLGRANDDPPAGGDAQ